MIDNLIKPINQTLLLAVFGLSLSHAAQAESINAVDIDNSNIGFKYQQMGVSMDGKFDKFNANIDFDPENPTIGSAQFQVELASVDTGTSDGDDEVVNDEWFNVSSYPVAVFTSSNIEQTADNSFMVNGTLSIKGSDIAVSIPTNFTPNGSGGDFVGEFTINRSDFNIGEGAWSTFDIVANEVTVNFSIATLSK